MTILDERSTEETVAPATVGGSAPASADDEAGPTISVAVTCAAVALATAAAAVVLTGVFTGVAPRLVGIAAACVGPAVVLLSYRSSRPAAWQYLTAPIALGLGAVVALAAGGTGSASLPTLIADAVRGGGLGQPPIEFAPGWRFLLVALLVLLGAGGASLGVGLARPRIGVAVAVPVVVGAALVQPPGSAVATSSVGLVLSVAALAVAAGATGQGDAAGARSFELLRLARGAVGLVVLGALLAALGSTGLLLPKSQSDQVVPPRPPKPAPAPADRVLFTVHTSAAGDTGPWTTGVLDSYVDDTWLLP